MMAAIILFLSFAAFLKLGSGSFWDDEDFSTEDAVFPRPSFLSYRFLKPAEPLEIHQIHAQEECKTLLCGSRKFNKTSGREQGPFYQLCRCPVGTECQLYFHHRDANNYLCLEIDQHSKEIEGMATTAHIAEEL